MPAPPQKAGPGGSLSSIANLVAAKAKQKSRDANSPDSRKGSSDSDDGKLVCIKLLPSPVAEEEANFAAVCEDFLTKAQKRHEDLMQRGKATQESLSALSTFLGEPADSDPAHTFGLIWSFVTSFDRAFVKVARAAYKDSSLVEELEQSNGKKPRRTLN